MNQQRAIRALRDGFHRHDKVSQEQLFLPPDAAPEIGQAVKVQMNLVVPLASANEPDQEIDWLAMTGEVIEVIDDDCVIASVIATTSLHPEDFSGAWLVELRREEGWEYPWVLTHLLPADPEPALPRGFTQDSGLGFRVAWLTADGEAVLGGLSETTGGPNEPHMFLPLSFPVGARTTTVWCVAASDGPESPRTELLVGCSDAVIVETVGPYSDDVLALYPGEPAVIRWDRLLAPEPMVPMKHALRQLLLELAGT